MKKVKRWVVVWKEGAGQFMIENHGTVYTTRKLATGRVKWLHNEYRSLDFCVVPIEISEG